MNVNRQKLETENKKHRKLLKDHIEINDLLMAENKALKEANSGLADVVSDCEDEIKALKDINEELLEAVTQSEIVIRVNGDIDKAEILIPIIRRAKTLMEKANE